MLDIAPPIRWRIGWRSLDLKWTIRGFQVGFKFLIGSILLKGVLTADKFLVGAISEGSELGSYVLYSSLASSMVVFSEAAVFSYGYQSLIRLNSERRYRERDVAIRWLGVYTGGVTIFASGGLYLLTPAILNFLDRPAYLDNWSIFPILIAANAAYTMSLIGHFGVYALGKDLMLLACNFITAIVFAFSCYLFIFFDFPTPVAYALLAAFTALLISKSLGYLYLTCFGRCAG
jgi:O-antigen/teichoic acid export membrane protein